MAYAVSAGFEDRPKIDGIILQAAVSDREAMVDFVPAQDLEKANAIAKDLVAKGQPDSIVPIELTKGFIGAKCTAARWVSLSQRPEDGGLDDFFSSDLPESNNLKTFGVVAKRKIPLCVMYASGLTFCNTETRPARRRKTNLSLHSLTSRRF